MRGRKNTSKTFWSRVQQTEHCWEWQGDRCRSGYGKISWNGASHATHRVAAFLHGLIPTLDKPKSPSCKEHVLHRCDNRACCRPDHFFLGSYSDNARDAYAKGRRKPHRGAEHKNAKLTSEQAIEIRKAYATGSFTQQQLAKTYNVSKTCISSIVRGAAYAP